MAYIPKSQIKSNLFTPGSEWYYVKNNSSYTGFYYQLSNGKTYTGKNPNSPPNEELINKKKVTQSSQANKDIYSEPNTSEYADNYDGFTFENQKQNTVDIQIYGILTGTDYSLERSKPQYSPVTPTLEDYKKTFYLRYFVCKINQREYIEIDKETYDNISSQNAVWMWEDYIFFTLNWYIKGDIDKTFNNNKGGIFIKEQEIKRKGLEEYLEKNYLQYYEYQEQKNLYTNGELLLTGDGKSYVGSYHINKVQGPMVGPYHLMSTSSPTPHDPLFYKRFYVSQRVNVLNQTNVIETGETQNVEYRAATITTPSSGGGSSSGGGY
tara:strand:- start:1540 stop:2508 length:969 start_codon:yes stop_codon:yes gene_type:complete